jgi:tetratricopeptide (TPR) repeat protein
MKASLRKVAASLTLILAAAAGASIAPAHADSTPTAQQLLHDARQLYGTGQYFKAARYAFAAEETDPEVSADADAQITLSLVRANLDQSATYFFIRTLQSGNKAAIRRVLTETQELLVHVGGDLLRKYLIRHTGYEDYDALNRSAYLYSLGKDALLSGRDEQAVGYFSGISKDSPLWPFALQLRGSAQAILGRNTQAIEDFQQCQSRSGDSAGDLAEGSLKRKQAEREAEDLKARCRAGEARTLYQMERFDDADQAYDHISKVSLVWPDILFEQAWNSFGRREYNRTLGKLVSYKSPALSFVFNTEADVLRAQAFLALCLFDDANNVINEFNKKYLGVGEKVKELVEGNSGDPYAFYQFGREALRNPLYTRNETYRMANRFIRGPYFQNLVASEHEVSAEAAAIHRFASMQSGTDRTPGHGFPGFLDQVLNWRLKSIRMLGGAFVKNSLMDYHAQLISDFDKMAFIKLEMLKQAKDKLLYKNSSQKGSGRARGNVEPSRRDYQYYWTFNGEFWNDELGDYVFGLESECRGDNGR